MEEATTSTPTVEDKIDKCFEQQRAVKTQP